MNKKKRELLKQQRLKEKGFESVDQLLDRILRPLDRKGMETINTSDDQEPGIIESLSKKESSTELDLFVECWLASCENETAQERRDTIITLSDWAYTKK